MIQLRDYQEKIVQSIFNFLYEKQGNPCVVAPTGCHAKGQGILMADGSIKKVEDISINDLVMGDDGTPRKVLKLHHGNDEMFRIIPVKGTPFIVNGNHILSLKATCESVRWPSSLKGTEIKNISVRDYLKTSNNFKHLWKLYKSSVPSFQNEQNNLPIPPYVLGLLLGDGSFIHQINFTSPDVETYPALARFATDNDCTLRLNTNSNGCPSLYFSAKKREGKSPCKVSTLIGSLGLKGHTAESKFIPQAYKTSSWNNRLEILAGLIDTDGSLSRNSYDFISKSKTLAEDMVFICRSVGLSANIRKCIKRSQTGFEGTYYRLSISGDCSIIPCRVKRKKANPRLQKKRVNITGFSVESIGIGEYFGFECDGNHLFMLDDFTVTHNSGKSYLIAEFVRRTLSMWPDTKILILTHQKELIEQDARALKRLWEDAEIGLYSAGIGQKCLDMPITYASIQSIYKAPAIPRFNIVLVDECHLINNEDKGIYRKFLARCQCRVVGFTATPYRLGQGMIIEEGSIFTDLIEEISIKELQRRGYLAMLRSKGTATALDVSKVQIRGGKFVESDLQMHVDVFSTNEAICDEIIKTARKMDRHHWIIFCTGKNHSDHIASILREKGIKAASVTSDNTKDEREEILYRFTHGEIEALTNCSILCLDEETEILTSRGFAGIDEMTMDKKIAAWKEDGSIEFTNPKLIVKRDREEWEKMVSLQGGKVPHIRVTDNHRMVIRCGGDNKKIKVVPASHLINKNKIQIPCCGFSVPEKMYCKQEEFTTSFGRQVATVSYNYRQKGIAKDKAKEMAESFVTRRRSMRYKNPFELTLQECRFIGFFLGDGSSYAGRYSISQSHAYEDNIEWIDNLLKDINIHFSRHEKEQRSGTGKDYVCWAFSKGTGGDGQLIENGIYPYIPYLKKDYNELFFGFSKKQILALLEGFWYADGNHHTKNTESQRNLTKNTIGLLNCLLAVCSMRGIKAWIRPLSKEKDYYKQLYSFTWTNSQSWNYCAKSEKTLETSYKKERVWCVTSSTSYLICKRKGKVFVTGNTTGFDYPDIDLIAMLQPTLSPGLYIQEAGRGLRLKSNGGDCLLLDFAGNVLRHGPITDVQPPRKKRDSEKLSAAPMKECPQCLELLPMSVRVCPECGYEFPKKDNLWQLFDGDVNGGGVTAYPVYSWLWMIKPSRKTGIDMVVADYVIHASIGRQVSEYYCVNHPGWPGDNATTMLMRLAKRVGANPAQNTFQDLIDDIAIKDPPAFILVSEDTSKTGKKYKRIVGKIWKDEYEELMKEKKAQEEMLNETRQRLLS